MNEIYHSLSKKLEKRRSENILRTLELPASGWIDFSSNDYLGMAREGFSISPHLSYGSTGSRLLTGNNTLIMETEKQIAKFHGGQAALIFNSGYDANLGFFSSVSGKGDTVIFDELIHASVRDGIRLGEARGWKFKHNSLADLESKLKKAGGNVFIAVESVYSMDGDFAPLQELALLAEKYHAALVVDEAHAIGTFGQKGEGLVSSGVAAKCFARLYTYGKAMGCHGASWVGSGELIDYLVNFSRPFIYTTSLPSKSIEAIKKAYDKVSELDGKRMRISKLTRLFKEKIESGNSMKLLASRSPVQSLILPGNDRVMQITEHVRKDGFDVRPIRYPTVPKGSERIRVVIHSFNEEKEVIDLARSFNKHFQSDGE